MSDTQLTSETRERLKAAFLECYSKKRWQDIKVSEITEAAGYVRGTFYRHFGSVEDVLRELEEDNVCRKLYQHVIERARTIDLSEATDLIICFHETRAYELSVLVAGNDGAHFLEMQREALKEMFTELLSRSLEMSPLQRELIGEYMASSRIGVTRFWLQHMDQISLREANNVVSNCIEVDLAKRVAQTIQTYGVPTPVKKISEEDLRTYPWEKGAR